MPLLSTAVSFKAQITGTPVNRAYSWVEVVDSESGGKVIPPNPRYGTQAKNPAYEANQNLTIPIGKVVTLWPGYNDIGGVGMDYRFWHPCIYSASVSGSGSGSGSGSRSQSASTSASASGSQIATVSGCSFCPNGAAAQFSFTLSGITNEFQNNCYIYNGTYVVSGGTTCFWSGTYEAISMSAQFTISDAGGGMETIQLSLA